MSERAAPLECLHLLVRLYYGDLRAPVEPVPPSPPPTCERSVWTVYLTAVRCDARCDVRRG